VITTVCSVCYLAGSIFYYHGYADTKLDVKTARYKKGGALKFLGLLAVIVMTIMMAGEANKWW
jgi:hypothetical protein